MGIRSKRICLLVLAVCLALMLCGCRTRTNGIQGTILPDSADSQTDAARQGEAISEDAASRDTGVHGDQTRENPQASRKEYDENAPAEIMPGTDHLLHEQGEGKGASAASEDALTRADRLNDQAEETATQTVAAEEAEQMGVSEDAEAADSAMTYFTVLLQDRMGSLFECQRMDAYWETAQDHVTIHKSSPEHALILNAGCYDVSARLLPENLRVDDGWVTRKSPGVLIKIVDGGALASERTARAMIESLRSREGWAAIDGVKNRRVLLLSQDLLTAPYLQTAAMVMIAKTANPDLFADVDLDQMLRMLMEEATGTLPTGVYYYKEEL